MSTATKLNVALLDLQRQYEPIKTEVLASIKEVFDSKQFILGPKVSELETQVAQYCQTKHAIGVSSGTDALIIALMALDIGPGDEVITTPFTFFATAGSISRVGATPVFVDIDPITYNINPSLIEEKITSKTKAIMPVHLFGQMADMAPIMAIANAHNLSVIEDAAQAIGASQTIDGKTSFAGSIGDMGCFSFFPSKNLGACGDGGIVTTNDDVLADKLTCLRMHGSKPKYHHHMVGGNFRLDPIQAAVLLVKLPHLNAQHLARQQNAEYYNQHLNDSVTTPGILPHNTSIYNQYTIRSANRDRLESHLKDQTIGHAIYYPIPLHLQGCFEYLGHQEGAFPESEKAAKEVISIPVYSELTDKEKSYVVNTINTL